MTQPSPYDRQTAFTGTEAGKSTAQLGVNLDKEFDEARLTVEKLRTNLALIQRDDTLLANKSVHPEALNDVVLALLDQGAFRLNGSWFAGKVLAVGDIFESGGALYLALTAHTAADLVADVAAKKVVGPIFNPDTSNNFPERLAASDGAVLVGTPEGTLYDLLYKRSGLSLYRGGIKKTALSWAECLTMAADLSAMRGYAQWAGTTGGVGYPVYPVWNNADDVNTPNTFRWAVAQAKAGGGGQIIFKPWGHFTIDLQSRIFLDFNNITIDAPGRNVSLAALNNVEMLRLDGCSNVVIQRMNLLRWPHFTNIDNQYIEYIAGSVSYPLVAGQTVFPVDFPFFESSSLRVRKNRFVTLVEGVDYTVTGGGGPTGSTGTVVLTSAVSASDSIRIFGTLYQEDGLSIYPNSTDKIWINECSFTEHTDGALDITNANLLPSSPDCRITVSRCYFRRQNEAMAIGSSATSAQTPPPTWAATALAETPKVFVTLDSNTFEGCAQRTPRVGALAFVHKVNNVHIMSGYYNDDGTWQQGYASWATTGGKLLSEGDLLRLGVASLPSARGMYATTDAWTDASRVGPGALKNNGSVAEGTLTIDEANTASVPSPPYGIAVTPVPAAGPQREAFAAAIVGASGAEISPLADMSFHFVSDADAAALGIYADGYNVVKVPGGYRRRMRHNVPASGLNPVKSLMPSFMAFPRGYTLGIVSDAITLRSDVFFAVDTEGLAASDTLSTINGGKDGQYIMLRAASVARTITITSAGNIATPVPILLDNNTKVVVLKYESGQNKWQVLSAPVSRIEADYTPTLTSVANVTGSSINRFAYSQEQIGGWVRVDFSVNVTPTAANTITDLGVSLPIASNLANPNDLLGSGSIVFGGLTATPVIAIGDATNDRATIRFAAPGTGTYAAIGSFRYKVL